jgi:glycosyltransferase involved in cell wall biosynthesis
MMSSLMMQHHVRFLLIGGLAQSLINFRAPLLRGLVDAGCEVHVAADAVESDIAIVETLHQMSVSGHSVPIARAGMNPFADLKTLVELIRLMRQIRPTMMLGYTIKPVIWGVLAASIANVPMRYAMITGLGYAFTGEATRKRKVVQYVARLLYRTALSQCSRIFFQNPDDLALFRQLRLIPKDMPVTIVNGSGVDLAHYPRQPLPDEPIRFLMIARLLGDKGVREYAASAKLVRQQYPDATFHLVGGLDPNPDAIDLAEIENWTSQEDIVWHGAQNDVRPFLADAHVFVLPSYREGTPRTVLEAMATGRAIVTTDAPGCRETVTNGDNGFLVPPRDSHALSQAMLRFIAEPHLIKDMAERSQQIVLEKYAADKVTAHMLTTMNIGKI